MCWDDIEEDDQDDAIMDFINLPGDAPPFMRSFLLEDLAEYNGIGDVLRQHSLNILMKRNNTRPEAPVIREPKRILEYTEQEMHEKFRFTHAEVMMFYVI